MEKYLKGLKVGDVVECIKDVYILYDVGMTFEVKAFEKGNYYRVASESYINVGCAYIKDPEDGCYHGITSEHFKLIKQ